MNRTNYTPVKRFSHRPNDFCRVSRENIKITGCSFSDKNKEFLDISRTVVASDVQETKDLSQVLCQKCTVLKYYKLLQQLQELERLRLDYKESVWESIDIQRDKRCAKDSPVDNHDIKNARGKACIFPAAPKSKRKLCAQNNNDIEDPFSALDVDYFCDSRDRKRSHEQR